MPAENDGRHRFLSGGHPDMPESWDGGSPLTRRGGAANHGGTGGQQQDRGHGERHRRGTRLAQAARLGGIHLAVRARLDRRLLRLGLGGRLLRSGLLAINLHQSLPGGLQRGKRVSHLGGSRVLVGGDLLRSVEGGLELVRAGLVIRLGELAGLRDHLVQSRLVGGLDSRLEGLREVRALERHRHRDLAGRSERLRQINRLTG